MGPSGEKSPMIRERAAVVFVSFDARYDAVTIRAGESDGEAR